MFYEKYSNIPKADKTYYTTREQKMYQGEDSGSTEEEKMVEVKELYSINSNKIYVLYLIIKLKLVIIIIT